MYIFLRCNRERRSEWRGWRQWVLWCYGRGSWVYHCPCRASLPQVSAPSPPAHIHCTNTLAHTLLYKEVNFETLLSHIAIYLTLFTHLQWNSNILASKCVHENRNLAHKDMLYFPLMSCRRSSSNVSGFNSEMCSDDQSVGFIPSHSIGVLLTLWGGGPSAISNT